MKTGLAAALPIVAGVGAAVAIPQTRRLLADDKITGTGRAEAAFETLVRIPLETALAEEVIFRGVLLGLGLRSRSRIGAVASSSIWFGLWHVYPTLGSLARGGGGGVVGDRPHHVGGATAGVVAATAGAGALFAALRLRSGSVAAPVIAHAALNMAAFAGAAAHGGQVSPERALLVVSGPSRVFLPVGRMPVRRAPRSSPLFHRLRLDGVKFHGPDPVHF